MKKALLDKLREQDRASYNSILDKLREQDRASYNSITRSEIEVLVKENFSEAALKKWAAEFAQTLVLGLAGSSVRACSSLLPDITADEETYAAVVGVLARFCQSGEFNTAQTIENNLHGLIFALQRRMIDRLAFIISEAHIEQRLFALSDAWFGDSSEK